jgi:hypothetical protein
LALALLAALARPARLRAVMPLVALVALVAVMPFAPVTTPAAATDDRPGAIRLSRRATKHAAEQSRQREGGHEAQQRPPRARSRHVPRESIEAFGIHRDRPLQPRPLGGGGRLPVGAVAIVVCSETGFLSPQCSAWNEEPDNAQSRPGTPVGTCRTQFSAGHVRGSVDPVS